MLIQDRPAPGSPVPGAAEVIPVMENIDMTWLTILGCARKKLGATCPHSLFGLYRPVLLQVVRVRASHETRPPRQLRHTLA